LAAQPSVGLPLHSLTMPRKFKKGYYVKGQFVAEGSELDLELKRELKGTDEQSRTDLKRESTELQKLGEALLTLRADLMARLDLSEKLRDAIAEAKRITNFEGKRRQMQFIGKLMRLLDPQVLDAVRTALDEQHNGSARENLALHQAEQWRDRLIADDDAVAQWINNFPQTDTQQLRALVRQARKDAKPTDNAAVSQGLAPRQGRAYREIFQLVRDHLSGGGDIPDAPDIESKL
jgi:ribosome-associated protein